MGFICITDPEKNKEPYFDNPILFNLKKGLFKNV